MYKKLLLIAPYYENLKESEIELLFKIDKSKSEVIDKTKVRIWRNYSNFRIYLMTT